MISSYNTSVLHDQIQHQTSEYHQWKRDEKTYQLFLYKSKRVITQKIKKSFY